MPDIGQSDPAGGFSCTVEFGGIARTEYLVQPVQGDEAAGVADADVKQSVSLFAADGNGYEAGILYCLNGVGGQIAED